MEQECFFCGHQSLVALASVCGLLYMFLFRTPYTTAEYSIAELILAPRLPSLASNISSVWLVWTGTGNSCWSRASLPGHQQECNWVPWICRPRSRLPDLGQVSGRTALKPRERVLEKEQERDGTEWLPRGAWERSYIIYLVRTCRETPRLASHFSVVSFAPSLISTIILSQRWRLVSL